MEEDGYEGGRRVLDADQCSRADSPPRVLTCKIYSDLVASEFRLEFSPGAPHAAYVCMKRSSVFRRICGITFV